MTLDKSRDYLTLVNKRRGGIVVFGMCARRVCSRQKVDQLVVRCWRAFGLYLNINTHTHHKYIALYMNICMYVVEYAWRSLCLQSARSGTAQYFFMLLL